jgi:hypothetical protein
MILQLVHVMYERSLLCLHILRCHAGVHARYTHDVSMHDLLARWCLNHTMIIDCLAVDRQSICKHCYTHTAMYSRQGQLQWGSSHLCPQGSACGGSLGGPLVHEQRVQGTGEI